MSELFGISAIAAAYGIKTPQLSRSGTSRAERRVAERQQAKREGRAWAQARFAAAAKKRMDLAKSRVVAIKPGPLSGQAWLRDRRAAAMRAGLVPVNGGSL